LAAKGGTFPRPESWFDAVFENISRSSQKEETMLGWAVTFLIIALISAVLGFGGIAGLSLEIAKIIFFVAIVLFAIAAVFGLLRGRRPTIT
jgi:uncharacterized membrane protein YtjA (UPF0391 family)